MKDYDGNEFKPEDITMWYNIIESGYRDIKQQYYASRNNLDEFPNADGIREEYWALEARYEDFLEEYPEVLV